MSEQVRRYLVRGRVQGVYFRASCRSEAVRLGVHGHALNREDGAVEVLALGSAAALAALEAWLWCGPALARVDEVEVTEASEAVAYGFRTG